jgi:hypothetical protein
MSRDDLDLSDGRRDQIGRVVHNLPRCIDQVANSDDQRLLPAGKKSVGRTIPSANSSSSISSSPSESSSYATKE